MIPCQETNSYSALRVALFQKIAYKEIYGGILRDLTTFNSLGSTK